MLRRLTIERSMTIILFALIFALAARVPVDTDTWWHIRSGEYTLTHGMIYADPFSFTKAGETWINHSWGSQIVLYAAWQIGGAAGLSIFMAALATAGMYFVYKMGEGSPYLRAFALILGSAAAAVFWSPRPQMFSFLAQRGRALSALSLSPQRGRPPLADPDHHGVWGNLHAGFSIGFIFMGGVIAGESLGNIFAPQGELPDVAADRQADRDRADLGGGAGDQPVRAANAARALPDGRHRRAAEFHSGMELAQFSGARDVGLHFSAARRVGRGGRE